MVAAMTPHNGCRRGWLAAQSLALLRSVTPAYSCCGQVISVAWLQSLLHMAAGSFATQGLSMDSSAMTTPGAGRPTPSVSSCGQVIHVPWLQAHPVLGGKNKKNMGHPVLT
jgi:hypothetical protein